MQYSNEFKERCSQALMGTSSLPNLINALNDNNHILVRWCLEDGLDDPELFEEMTSDEGELIILKAKQLVFKQRQELYSEWMEQFVIANTKELVENV